MENTMELKDEELEQVSGGSFWESEAAAVYVNNRPLTHADYARAGITFKKNFIGSDEYYLCGRPITKGLAGKLTVIAADLWESKYAESGELNKYIHEWREYLKENCGVNWSGVLPFVG